MTQVVAKRIISGRDYAVLKDLGGGLFHESFLIEGEHGREVLRTYAGSLADELERQWLRWRDAELGHGSADLLGFTEVGSIEGRPFVLRRWVEAESFEVHVRRLKFNWRTPEEALEIGQAICRPIAALHQLGLVHGHITNNNVFFGSDGTPMLTDPWLAHPTAMTLHHARKGMVRAGSLAPEQQHLRTKIDARTDVWALGLLLCRLYTRKPDLVVNQRILMELSGAKLPMGLLKVLWQAIQEDAGNRFPDAGTLATALAEVTLAEHQRTVHVRPVPLAKGVGGGMNPALKKAAIVVVAVGVIASGAAIMQSRPAIERNATNSAGEPKATPSIAPTPASKDRVPTSAWTLDVPGAEPLTLIGMLPFDARLGHTSEKNNPPHTVVLTQPFSLATKQVTLSQFAAFVQATNYTTTAETAGDDTQRQVWSVQGNRIAAQPGLSWRNPGFPQEPSHPVTSISWDDAQAFCVWLSARSGLQVRLPTEAEWEFCARAGAETKYAWGDDPAGAAQRSNVADQRMKQAFPSLRSTADWDDGFAFTAPVASFAPNPLGFHDLGGNVWEWCQDRFSEAPFPSRSVDPVGPAQGGARSFRGSAYNEFPPNGLSYRYGNIATMGCTVRGFRVAVSGEWRTLDHAASFLGAAQVSRTQVGSFLGIEGTIVKYVPPPEPRTPHVLTLVDRSPDPLEIIYWDNDAAPAIHDRYGKPAVGRRVSVAGVLADYRGRLQVRVLRLDQIRLDDGG